MAGEADKNSSDVLVSSLSRIDEGVSDLASVSQGQTLVLPRRSTHQVPKSQSRAVNFGEKSKKLKSMVV